MSTISTSSVPPSDGANGDDKRTKLCEFCQSEIPVRATRCRFCTSALNSRSSSAQDHSTFSVIREKTSVGGHTDSKIFIVIKGKYLKLLRLTVLDFQLSQTLRGFLPGNDAWFEKEPRISGDELFAILPQLRKPWSDGQRVYYRLNSYLTF